MKKIILFFAVCMVSMSLHAQLPLDFGLKLGFNSSKISTDINNLNEDNVNNFLAGAFIRVNLSKLYIQPEAYFCTKGGDLGLGSVDLKTIDVPVLLGYKIIDQKIFNIRIHTGPVFSFKLDGDVDNITQINANDLKDNCFAWQVGAGVDVLFLTFDARLERGISSIVSNFGDAKNNMFVVSLGIKLL